MSRLRAYNEAPRRVAALRRLRSRHLAILMYHGVTAATPPVENWGQLDAREFTRQMEHLAAHYRVLPLDETVRCLAEGRTLPRRAACVTFDDGFRSVATTAFPILRRLQIPATVFLVTGAVGTGRPAWPDQLYHHVAHTTTPAVHALGRTYELRSPAQRAVAYRSLVEQMKTLGPAEHAASFTAVMDALGHVEIPPDAVVAPLDWAEVDEMARTGLVQFGSHTHTHPILSRRSADVQRWELETSRDVLRERGLSSDLFAYPNGTAADFTGETKRLLRELGYRCAVTTLPGLNVRASDVYELRRVNVGAETQTVRFAFRMAGF